MAGLGWKQWVRERLTVDDLQGYLQDQVVMQFASASARTAELPQADRGMVCFLEDVGRWEGCVTSGAPGTWEPISYGSPPVLRVQRAAGQTIGSTVWVPLSWDTELRDTHGMHTAGVVTCKRAGDYWVAAGWTLAVNNVGGRRGVRVLRATAGAPGTWLDTGVGRNVGAAGPENGVEASGLVTLGLNDLIRVEAWHDTGVNQNTANLNYGPTKLDMTWVAP